MGWIGPRRNRREVAGPAAGPMGTMAGRTPYLQPAAPPIFLETAVRLKSYKGIDILPADRGTSGSYASRRF